MLYKIQIEYVKCREGGDKFEIIRGHKWPC